jgi:hypothetical protein
MIYKLLQMSQNQAVDKGSDYVMPYLENGAWTRIVINIERVVEQMVIHKLTLTGSTGKPVNGR